METGNAILLVGAAALAVYYVRQKQARPDVVVLSSPFGSHAEIPCPQTVLPMCPGSIPKCYSNGVISCGPEGGYAHDIPDMMNRLQEFCVSNPNVCKPPAVQP